MPDKLPSEEELEAEFSKAKRGSSQYKLQANGYLIVPVLAVTYVVGGMLYLCTLFDPSAPAAGDFEGVGSFFLATNFLMVGAFACALFMMVINATLSRPVNFLLIMAFTLGILAIFYLIGQWAKPQLGIS